MTPTPLPNEGLPGEDDLLFSGAQVEWSDLPGQMPSSLDDFRVPEAWEKAPPGRGANMSFGIAVLWCLLLIVVSQLLPALLIIAALTAGHLEEIRQLNGDPEAQAALIEKLLFSPGILVPLMALSQLALFSAAVAVLRWKLGADWKRMISLRLPAWDHLVLAVVGTPALLVVVHGMEGAVSQFVPNYSAEFLEKFIRATTTWPWWVAVLCIGVGPGIGEELYCRGFLGRGLVGRYGYLAGILLTSLLFGLIHMVPRQAILAGILGLALHFLYLATRSILIPMLVHFLNNSINILAVSQTMNVPLKTTLEACYDRNGLLFLFAAGMVLALVGLAFYQSRCRRISLDGKRPADSVETPEPGGAVQLVREPIPPGTVVLVVLALSAFAAIWWNL